MKENRIRVLVVEDDKIDQMAFERYIRTEKIPYDYRVANSVQEAKSLLKSESFDLILQDYQLGDGTAFDLFEDIQDIPFIIVTGTGDEAIAVSAMKAGAYDYLIKDIEGNYLKTLPLTVENALKRKHTENELRKYQERLEDLVQQRTTELNAEIAERKRTEEALRESEERLRGIIASVTDFMLIIDDKYHVIWVNEITQKNFGDDLIGKQCYQVYYHNDIPCESCIAKKTFADGKTYHYETVVTLPDGSQRVFWCTSSVSSSHHDGRPKTVIEICRDITDRKKLEEQLRQAQKMEAIGTLAGGIAHDFNNILFPIIGYTEMLMDELPDESNAQKNLTGLLNATFRARDLIQQILTFSRHSDAERKPLKIQYIINEALKLLRATLPTTIQIRQRINKKCSAVLADPTQIHQVIMNLATNAYHAMREKGGELEITLDEVELEPAEVSGYPDMPSGKYLKLTISDTGHGIPREIIGLIFDPYFTTKKMGEGTGLGLAVVRGIVKNHDGHITVYSEPDRGTTFHIYIPLIDTGNSDSEEVFEKEVPTGDEKIMLVDDEEAIILMQQQMLRRLGYEVTALTHSPEALEIFRRNPHGFDLIITDTTMPEMTGIELAREMMQIRPDIPIILCTGFSELITQESAKALGIREYVMKPMLRSTIAKTIRQVLDET